MKNPSSLGGGGSSPPSPIRKKRRSRKIIPSTSKTTEKPVAVRKPLSVRSAATASKLLTPEVPKKNGHKPAGILDRFKKFVHEARELVVRNYLSVHTSPARIVTGKAFARPTVPQESLPTAEPTLSLLLPPIVSLPPHPRVIIPTTDLVARSAEVQQIRFAARQSLNELASLSMGDTYINNDKHVILDPRRLGFTKAPFISELLDRSFLLKWSAENLKKNHVLDLCHPTKGYCLLDLEEYPEQEMEDLLLIIAQPIPNPRYKEVLFTLERCRDDRKQWLSVASATPGCQVPLDHHCLFRERVIVS